MRIACTCYLRLGGSTKVDLTDLTALRHFIKEGRVSESGTHDQLLAKRGDYYEHVQLQGLSK